MGVLCAAALHLENTLVTSFRFLRFNSCSLWEWMLLDFFFSWWWVNVVVLVLVLVLVSIARST